MKLAELTELVRSTLREKFMDEMSQSDVHFKAIMKFYDKGTSNAKKALSLFLCGKPNANRNQIVKELMEMGYHEIQDVMSHFKLTTEYFDKKGVEHVAAALPQTEEEPVNEAIITEDTKRATILGIDFNISEMNGRIFFSFVDKKAASIKIRQIGTNKIVNLIQKSLDNAYGKGEFFFKSGDHAEFQNGYLFQRNATNIKLNKLKFESVNESVTESKDCGCK